MKVIPAAQAVDEDFAKFNSGPHLCVDVPDGHFTVTCRTSEGKKMTFAFVPYKENGPAQCVDVQHHTSGKVEMNGDTPCPVQRVICFTIGSNTFRSKLDDPKPTTLMTVLLHDR